MRPPSGVLPAAMSLCTIRTSQLGGSFTVSIVETLAGNAVKVRVWYGRATTQGWEAWKDWDGYTFQTDRTALTNDRVMPLFK
ncbi:hypothetical protein [Mesorhizobium sp.]|uniref:hypothetical protein n=2 Tax=Mesorhizobium TaxID=68287 RepID=UPI0025D89596|nr:hypothetical protein [Mesorhizobium sp.]